MSLAVVAWLCSLAVGFVAWERYDSTPGRCGLAADELADAPREWRLVLFVHSHCPCSRASVRELGELVRTADPGLRVEVVFVRPPDAPDGWERSELWKAAEEIPGARVRTDVDGKDAQRAGAETSGHLVLYDPSGRVAFYGGITSGRGRTGECTARREILAILAGREPAARTAPVFGCELFGADACLLEKKGPTCPR